MITPFCRTAAITLSILEFPHRAGSQASAYLNQSPLYDDVVKLASFEIIAGRYAMETGDCRRGSYLK